MQRLLDAGYTVLLETSGERPLERVPEGGDQDRGCEVSKFRRGRHLSHGKSGGAGPHDEVKFVLSDRADYEFARDFVARHGLAQRVNAVLFSPAFRKDATGARDSSHCLLDPQELAEWMLADDVPARLRLADPQVYLGSGDAEGDVRDQESVDSARQVNIAASPECTLKTQRQTRAVVLLSGGMDSCVCAALAARDFRCGGLARQLRPAHRRARAAGVSGDLRPARDSATGCWFETMLCGRLAARR